MMREPTAALAVLADAATALDRRTVLRLGGALLASGAGSTGCGGLPAHLVPPAEAAPVVLSPRTWAAFTAATMRLVGPRGAELVAAGTIVPAAEADALLARSPALAEPLEQGLWLLELGVWPLVAKLRPFTALGGPAQDAVLHDLETSRLGLKRALFGGVKSLAMAAFYAAPGANALSGYPGPFGPGPVTIADAMAGADEDC